MLLPDAADYQLVVTSAAGAATSAVARLTVVLSQPEIISDIRYSYGQATITALGIAGQTYRIEAATNLAPPIVWTPIATNVANSDGQLQFNDPAVANLPHRFYRIAR